MKKQKLGRGDTAKKLLWEHLGDRNGGGDEEDEDSRPPVRNQRQNRAIAAPLPAPAGGRVRTGANPGTFVGDAARQRRR